MGRSTGQEVCSQGGHLTPQHEPVWLGSGRVRRGSDMPGAPSPRSVATASVRTGRNRGARGRPSPRRVGPEWEAQGQRASRRHPCLPTGPLPPCPWGSDPQLPAPTPGNPQSQRRRVTWGRCVTRSCARLPQLPVKDSLRVGVVRSRGFRGPRGLGTQTSQRQREEAAAVCSALPLHQEDVLLDLGTSSASRWLGGATGPILTDWKAGRISPVADATVRSDPWGMGRHDTQSSAPVVVPGRSRLPSHL